MQDELAAGLCKLAPMNPTVAAKLQISLLESFSTGLLQNCKTLLQGLASQLETHTDKYAKSFPFVVRHLQLLDQRLTKVGCPMSGMLKIIDATLDRWVLLM